VGLIQDLGSGNVAVDTGAFISFIEEHPKFLPVTRSLFREGDEGKRNLKTSPPSDIGRLTSSSTR